MKRKIVWLILMVSILLFSSCIEVFQYVSIKNGNVDMTLKYTFQKMLFEFASSFSGEEVDYDDMLGTGDDFFEVFKGSSGQVEIIDTELEIGAKVRIVGPLDLLNEMMEGNPEFVPIYQNGNYKIIIPTMSDDVEDDTESEGLMAFFASSKYRLLVDLKDDLRKIESAKVIIDEAGEGYDEVITIEKYGSTLLIEIPMMYLFMSPVDIIIELL